MSTEPVRVERHDATQVALRAAIEQVNQVVFGKRAQINLGFACLLAGGHLLIEDLPGVGKTTLAHAMATSLGLSYQRIQFTSDLLPSDILGVSIFDRDTGQFRFHAGPIFAQLVLADEINRATPKTQSALLEAMAEQQVTADGESRPLPQPFLVVATQNPVDLAGTFPLPDSQLDRFLMRISLGYPDAEGERQMLAASDRRELLTQLGARLDSAQMLEIRRRVAHITTSAALIDYVQRLLAATRSHAQIRTGLSPRAGLALLAAARAVSYLAGRAFVLPEDVQTVFGAVAAHRLVPAAEALLNRDALAADVVKSVRVD
ncbi:MAG: AAA family ATPase [Rhodanobacteraceae bacterium]|nr:AAA family ATPase [Rhodanobacteraceae bacterium]